MSLDQLPVEGFVRVRQIIGDRRASPPVIGPIPVSPSCWWQGVRDGRFPKPVKLGPRTTVWRVEDIRGLIRDLKHER